MGARIYAAGFNAVSCGSAVQDIFSLLAGAAKGVVLHQIHLEASGVSTAYELNMRFKRGTATVSQGSGGSAPTPGMVDSGDSLAATATLHCNDTSQATTTGNFTGLVTYFNWNVLLPFDWTPGPQDEDRPTALVNQVLILDFPSTITTTTISGWISWREVP